MVRLTAPWGVTMQLVLFVGAFKGKQDALAALFQGTTSYANSDACGACLHDWHDDTSMQTLSYCYFYIT